MADTYTVVRRRTMAAPADRIFLLLSNFQQWTRWSPWEELDPNLERAYGGLKGLVRDDKGELHRHINLYVNSESIDALGGLSTPLRDGDEVAIIPALAGGAR